MKGMSDRLQPVRSPSVAQHSTLAAQATKQGDAVNVGVNQAAIAIIDALLDQLYAVRTEQIAASLRWSPDDPARVLARACREADLADQLRALGVP
jgi:hypothetical protein